MVPECAVGERYTPWGYYDYSVYCKGQGGSRTVLGERREQGARSGTYSAPYEEHREGSV